MIGKRCPGKPAEVLLRQEISHRRGCSRGKRLELRFRDKKCRHRQPIGVVLRPVDGSESVGERGRSPGRGGEPANQRVGRSEVGDGLWRHDSLRPEC